MRFSNSRAIAAPAPHLPYTRLARATHLLCAWLLARFGQPDLSCEEAFLAAATDHADCERRQRWLARRHEDAWRRAPLP